MVSEQGRTMTAAYPEIYVVPNDRSMVYCDEGTDDDTCKISASFFDHDGLVPTSVKALLNGVDVGGEWTTTRTNLTRRKVLAGSFIFELASRPPGDYKAYVQIANVHGMVSSKLWTFTVVEM